MNGCKWLMLFGNRARGAYDVKSDWDMLILTTTDHPQVLKWELQEKLFHITILQGTRANILLVQKANRYTAPEYEILRTRIEEQLMPVKEIF
jgi:predicted nucleotidyltransferase